MRADRIRAALVVSLGFTSAAACWAAELAYIESFTADNSGWGLLHIAGQDQDLYEAPWDASERLVWDYLDEDPVQVYLFADAQSSGGRLIGDYAAAGVRSILFDLAFTNADSVDDLGTYLLTAAGRQFEHPLALPTGDLWQTYETPLAGTGWWLWVPTLQQWQNTAPSAQDLAAIVEVGVVLRTIDTPQAWDVFLDDFQLLGAERVPLATLDFVEEFGRGNASWLSFTRSDGTEVEDEAPWDPLLGILTSHPAPGVDELWLGADVYSSRGRLSGDFAAAGAEALVFDLQISSPASVAEYGAYLLTGAGRYFEFLWEPPSNAKWWAHTVPLSGVGWKLWEPGSETFIDDSPVPGDLADVAETGVVVRPAPSPGAWSLSLDNFGLAAAPAPPKITAFLSLGGNAVRLDWTAPGPVYVEAGATPAGPQWTPLAGPIAATTWSGELPANTSRGFVRLRLE